MTKKDKSISTMAITAAHIQCIIDMLPDLERTPLYRHNLKRHLKGLEKEYDFMFDGLFSSVSDNKLETSQQSLDLSEVTNNFLKRMFLLGNKLTDSQKIEFTDKVNDIFESYESKTI